MEDGQIYEDINGDKLTLYQMVRREPNWAATRIRVGEEAVKLLSELMPDMESRVEGLREVWPGNDVNEARWRNELLLARIKVIAGVKI